MLQLLSTRVLSPHPWELSHCIVAQGKRNQRSNQAFKLVFVFSRILLSAVARCLPMFTIQHADKDCIRKDLKESRLPLWKGTSKIRWWLSESLTDEDVYGESLY